MVKYKTLSFFYDLIDILYFNRKSGSPRTALINLIPDEPIRVLDVCAGTGTNSLLIARNKQQAKITALDLSADMLKIADNKFKKAGAGNIETVKADAAKTGLDDNSFDVILLSLTLHELNNAERKAILSEAKRLLSDDGKIIVIEWEQPKTLFKQIMFSLVKLMEPKGFKEFLYSNLSAYFEKYGLITLEKRSCDYSQVLVLM